MTFEAKYMGGNYDVTATGTGVNAVLIAGDYDGSDGLEAYCAEILQFKLAGEYMPDEVWTEYALAKQIGASARKPQADDRDMVF